MRMTRNAPGVVALWLALAVVAQAGEVAGVKMPDSATIEGKTLRLNGMGLRKKMVFKVYVAGLYLENASREASAVISSDQVKCIQLHMLRNLAGSELSEAIAEAFWKNSKGPRSGLEPRLQKLTAWMPSVVTGDLIILTYAPGKGTIVAAKGEQKGVIEGKDFADALFSVWLGEDPVQSDLKKALLGN